jgi:uncharacterized protein (DUF1919 family)
VSVQKDIAPEFSVISNNCWGAEVYKTRGIPYSTPFVGLFLHADCFLALLRDFRHTIQLPIRFTQRSRYSSAPLPYPVGLLGDTIEIHFQHYASPQEAAEKWARRVQRITPEDDRLFFKMDDRDGCTPEHLKEFHRLPFRHKISFTATEHPELKENLRIPLPGNPGCVMDGLKLYYVSIRYFDIRAWLNGEGLRRSVSHRLRWMKDILQYSVR